MGGGIDRLFLRSPVFRDRLCILAYHRILDIPDESSFPFDPELVSAGIEQFADQMTFVRKYFNPVSLSDVIAAIDGGQRLPARPIVITFDDGHRDNYTNAFPILKRLEMGATIFLSSGYVGGSGTFWFDRVAEVFFGADAGVLQVECVDFSAIVGDVPSRRIACEVFLEQLKRVPNRMRVQALGELEARFGSKIPSGANGDATLDWAMVREMSGAGIEFGSHTVTHPILTTLGDDELDAELQTSRETIRQATGQSVDAIAYPAGNAYAFDDRVIAAAKRCGYKLGVSYVSGINRLASLDRFGIRRLHVERYISSDQFQAMLALPELFA